MNHRTRRHSARFPSALVVLALVSAGCTAELEQQNADLRRQLDELHQTHDQATARLQELEQANAAMTERLAQLGTDFEALQRALAEARAREEAQRSRLDSFRRVIEQFRALMASGRLRVRIVRGKMVVELPAGVLFDSGAAELREEGEASLAEVASILAQIEGRELLIAGHTDNVPLGRRGRFRDNWELSAARGVAVATFLAQQGVPENRLAAAGYADTQPVASNETEEGRAQNRRIEIILMPNLDELPDLSQLENELGD